MPFCSSFFGNRYAPPENDPELLVIYDVNGFVAGMHSVVAKKFTSNDAYWGFSDSSWYRDDVIFGEDVYLTTAYFVHPEVICGLDSCQAGRTLEDFEAEGTGYVLHFQNGPDVTDLLTAPSNLHEVKDDVSAIFATQPPP